MRRTVAQIRNDSRFRLMDELQYDSIVEFASEYLRKSTRSITFYIIFVIAFFVLQWSAFVYGIIVNDMNIVSLLKQYLYGLIASLTIIIPAHELIHAFGYFLLGARKISFGAAIRNFAFYAVADDFVVGRRGFIFLAISPFIIVSLLMLAGFIFVGGYASYTYISALFFHSTMCAGDFAMLSYFEYHRDKDVYTFDDVKNKTSYFYYKLKE